MSKIISSFRNKTFISKVRHKIINSYNEAFVSKSINKKVESEIADGNFHRLLSKEKYNQKRIIVSLTTIPSRIDKIIYVLERMFRQSLKPNKIILYISNEETIHFNKQFDPYFKSGFEVRYVDDVGPATKFFYAMQDFPNEYIITVDDDIIYPVNLIELLMIKHRKYSDAVVAARVHRMIYDDKENLLPYCQWEFNSTKIKKPSLELFATGVGGVLYPPKLINSELFNKSKMMKLSPKADDVWLKGIELYSDVPVVLGFPKGLHLIIVKGSQDVALSDDNVTDGRNDLYIKNVWNEYRLEKEKFR